AVFRASGGLCEGVMKCWHDFIARDGPKVNGYECYHHPLDRQRPRILAAPINPRSHGLANAGPCLRPRALASRIGILALLEQHMTACDICGYDPCDMPTFCQAAREHLARER